MLTPVLVYTDTQRIADEQATLANVVIRYQAIYNAILAAGVTATIAEIDALVNNARRQSQTTFVNDYILNKLVAQVSPYTVNGVTWPTQAVKNIIAMPDTSAITAALQPVWGSNGQSIFIRNAGAARTDLLSLAADVISTVGGANATIAALFTYYTQSDPSTTMATQLQAICDALNTFNTANGGVYIKKIPTESRNSYGYLESSIAGIAVLNNTYVVSLVFIRKYEQTGTLFF